MNIEPNGCVRAFISIEPAPDALRAIRKVQRDLQRRWTFSCLRWTPETQLHLTLQFLGDVRAGDIPAFTAALDDVCRRHAPLELAAQGLGAFPNPHRPSVVWLGIAGDLVPLASLQRDVAAATAALGVPTESRPFHPHLTLARVKPGPPALMAQFRQALSETHLIDVVARWTATDIHFMQSELHNHGATHTRLHASPLRT